MTAVQPSLWDPVEEIPAPSSPVLAHPEELRTLLEIPFTDEQLAAATAPLEPGVIVAGAGSGKTSVMAARVVWLVGTRKVQRDRVLGLTFTVKAAGELSGRIAAALAKLGDDPSSAAGAPTVTTYHGYAGRLLTEHALLLGLEPGSRLLADATRYQLAARVLRRHRGPLPSLTRSLRYLVGELVLFESECSEHLLEPADVIAHADEHERELTLALAAENARPKPRSTEVGEIERRLRISAERRELALLATELRAAKVEAESLDFGDQIAHAARLAREHPTVGTAQRAAYDIVLLDEYQDTSVAQRLLLTGLFGGGHPVTAVGDPCQAIYGWRGASVGNLIGFRDHFPKQDGSLAGAYSLATNQRSGGLLLRLANQLSEVLRHKASETAPDVVELRPRPDAENDGRTVVALHETWADECTWVAAGIAAAVAAGTRAGECAVLVRKKADMGALFTALTSAGLPVEVVGLGGLLSVPEVADVIAVLELLDDPTANPAMVRILTGPRWRFGLRDLAALGRQARWLLGEQSRAGGDAADAAEVDALEAAVDGVDPCDVASLAEGLGRPGGQLSPEGAERAARLTAELTELREHVHEPLLDLVGRVVATIGLDVEQAASPEAVAAHRRDSLAAFLDVVAGYADLDGEQSLPAFLAYLAAAGEYEHGLDLATPARRDAVQLLTVHKSKGLEWDLVAVPDLTEKTFPSLTDKDSWPTTARVLPHPVRGDAEDLPVCAGWDKPARDSYSAETKARLEREERRLAYVAVTRARHVLLASGHWWGPTQKLVRGPSPYLLELRDHVESDASHGELAVWTDKPVDTENPLLGEARALTWPVPLEPEALARRNSAAALVLAGLETPDGGTADEALTLHELEVVQALDRDTALLLEELARERAPERIVPLPRSLSASQLVRLGKDPDGLARDLARPLPRPPAPAARRGTRFHAWVEARVGQRPLLDPDELPGAEDDARAEDADLAALQEAFLAGAYATRTPFAVEAPFVLSLGGRLIRGRIDAVYDLGGGRFEVIDWKTGREDADPWQLGIYRLAWARQQGVPLDAVDAAFVLVRSGKVQYPELPDEAELAAALTDTAG
jgi:DNA helicase-2/ATP-dependent DNA helicase PcrA